MKLHPLPIDEVLPEVLRALADHGCVVLRAPTGAGKTTRVPPTLLAESWLGGRGVVLLEPRRLAARAAARRMADERGSPLGDEIGYEVRFDRRVSPRTRLRVVTEGILVRMLQDDPFLDHIGAVVFDEFHERNLHADLALAMVAKVRREARPDLRIAIMSATLTPAPVAQFLDNCPITESAGRSYPVTVEYLPPTTPPLPLTGPGSNAAMVRAAAQAVHHECDRAPSRQNVDNESANRGDVLVFLPGVGEIQRTAEELHSWAETHGVTLLELYGDLPPEQQDKVFTPSDKRKIILSTNVAETSVTIPGITCVVDTGLARVLTYDPAVGLDRLNLQRITRENADQRAGRAGRTAPGRCLRLWTETEHRRLEAAPTPEVRRVDLAGVLLELYCWGEARPAEFPWFEPPPPETVARAEALLRLLGALDERGITTIGRRMVRLPVHPRLARLLLEGQRLGQPARCALVAAWLTERDPFGRSHAAAEHHSESDVLDRLQILETFERDGRPPRAGLEGASFHVASARFLLRARDQLLHLLERESKDNRKNLDRDEAVARALLVAFPDRLVRRRETESRRGVMVGGRGVRLADSSAVGRGELFLAVDMDAGKEEALVRQASLVQREWLPAEHLRTSMEAEFDPRAQRVTGYRRVRFADLVLEEAASAPDEATAARVLAAAAAADLSAALPLDDPAVRGFLARTRCLATWMPELHLPLWNDNDLRALLPLLCQGRRSFADLKKSPLLDFLRGQLTSQQAHALTREAPEKLEVPSGSRIALTYEEGRPPVLAVRIQEVFGLRDSPRVAGGRVKVLLHLLAPNMRPQQVTDDLRSFWDNTYSVIRKELRARYPKHSWPEDPWNAPPERRPRRQKPST